MHHPKPADPKFALACRTRSMVQSPWLSFGGVTEVRGLGLLVAVVVALSVAPALWAGPFSEVSSDHWTYQACSRLVATEALRSPGGNVSFSGHPQLTRFEFGIALMEPRTALQRETASLPPGADPVSRVQAGARALRLSPSLSENQVAAAAADLRLLVAEFSDVLAPIGFDPASTAPVLEALSDKEAVRQWRAQALSSSPSRSDLAPLAPPAGQAEDTLRVPLARGTVALTYERDMRSPEVLDYFALSAADASLGSGSAPLRADASPRDPRVSRLRTAYEYDLSSALSLSLAYEEIARRGHGLSALDTAYLASLGVGYRFNPSASVKLSYSLLEYSNFVFDTPKVRDHVAETAVTIEF